MRDCTSRCKERGDPLRHVSCRGSATTTEGQAGPAPLAEKYAEMSAITKNLEGRSAGRGDDCQEFCGNCVSAMIWSEYAAQMRTLLTIQVKLCSRFSASASKVQYYGRVSVGHQSADPATQQSPGRLSRPGSSRLPCSHQLKFRRLPSSGQRREWIQTGIDAVVANATFNTLVLRLSSNWPEGVSKRGPAGTHKNRIN